VNFLAVDVGGTPEQARSFLAARHFTGLRVAVTSSWPQGFGVDATPATIVMDRFARIEFVHAGLLANVGTILAKDLDALPRSR
jgi:hypothetical protein